MCEHFYILQYNDTNGTYNRTPAGYVIMIHFILKQFLCPLNRTNLANSLCSCDQNTWWISTCLFNKKKDTLDIICAFVLYLRAKIILETEQSPVIIQKRYVIVHYNTFQNEIDKKLKSSRSRWTSASEESRNLGTSNKKGLSSRFLGSPWQTTKSISLSIPTFLHCKEFIS